MKRILALAFAIFICVVCKAQTTSVTATVTSPNGYVWAAATYSATFVPYSMGTVSLLNGAQFTQSYSGTLNSSGQLSLTLADNNIVTPANSQWRFNICAAAGVPCFQAQTTITGASMSLTTLLIGLAPNPYDNIVANPQPGTAVIKPFPSNGPGIVVVGNTNQTSPLAIFTKSDGSLGFLLTQNCIFFSDASGQCTAGLPFNLMTTPGDMIYENSNPAPARLPGNSTTTEEFLSQASSVPSWTSTLKGTIEDTGGQVFNVKAFGATGNGTTNDTTAFITTFSAACNGTLPGVVYVPAGNFVVGALNLPSNCKLTGVGTIVYPSAVGNFPITMNSNTQIEGLSFNGANNIGAAILGGSGASNIIIDHDSFTDFVNGSICFATACNGGSGTAMSDISISQNFFSNNEDGAAPPIFNVQCGDGTAGFSVIGNTFVGDGAFDIGIDGCTNSTISGNLLERGSNGFGGAIQPEATSQNVSGLIITNNTIIAPHFADGYSSCGIEMHTNGNGGSGAGAHILENFIVQGNYVTGAPSGGICLLYTTNDTNTPGLISDNVTVNNTGEGINVAGGTLTITGNFSSGNTGDGIDISCLDAPCQITGNNSTGNSGYGLKIGGSPWGPVLGNGTNTFDGNTAGTVSKGSAFNQNTIY